MPQQHLSKDKKLKTLLLRYDLPAIKKQKNVGLCLMKSIVSQQLSVKAAASIYAKFLSLYPQRPSYEDVLQTPHETLRSAGLSNAKANYIKNIASFWLTHKIEDKHFTKLSNQEVIEWLTQIKGVGQWTVEMLLMFTLGRKNVFSTGDLGIQQAMCKLYGWEMNDKALKSKMLNKAQLWDPFQTYACLLLWKSKDEK